MKKIYLFLTAAIVSLPFWLGVNLLQKQAEGFFAQKNPLLDILTAQIKPIENATSNQECVLDNITSESFLVLKVSPDVNYKILLEKTPRAKLPIASITKLMTYLVASEFYKSEQKIIIPQEPIDSILKQGDVFSVKELIPIMLVESNNEAAFILAKVIGQEGFVDLMNFKAKELGLANTKFYNSIGVDPEDLKMPPDQINYSTAFDIALLSKHLIFNQPDFLPIVSQQKYPLYKDGQIAWILQSTNELLGEIPEVVGGKTGTTDRAGECLMAIAKLPQENNYLIAVVLNSKDRFNDMKTLLSCAQ